MTNYRLEDTRIRLGPRLASSTTVAAANAAPCASKSMSLYMDICMNRIGHVCARFGSYEQCDPAMIMVDHVTP